MAPRGSLWSAGLEAQLSVLLVPMGLCLCVFGALGICSALLPFSLQKHGIPVPVTPKAPWSMDENLMHIR